MIKVRLRYIGMLLSAGLLLTGCDEASDLISTAQAESSQPSTQAFSFPQECVTCHGDQPDYQLLGARMGYEASGHALGFERHNAPHAYYANGGGCQTCHTHEGFLDFVKNGKPAKDDFVQWPSQPSCFTCHKPHETGDFALRTVAPVAMADGAVFDEGSANLCVNCHQSRRDASQSVVAMPANKVSPYFGPHHGPQGDVFNGTNAYEFAGMSYSSSAHKLEIENGCVSCHMALPQGRYRSTAAMGGHSFGMSNNVHGKQSVNVAACASCHAGMKQAKSGPYYDYKANADYDQDGEVELAQLEVQGLLQRLVNDQGTGALQTLAQPLFDAEGKFIRSKDKSVTRSVEEIAGLYNYKLFGAEDRSLGIHNYTYTVQVLTDTIAALDKEFDTDNRP